jgi:nucleotide-binding universal stress UspA family protein
MFDRILLTVDGSAQAERATDVAAAEAKLHGSEVLVLHVREKEFLPRGGVIDVESSPEAMELIDSTAKRLKDQGVNVRGEILVSTIGGVAKVIVEAARSEGADLVVMGTRGLSEWGGLILGSVTHRVLHLSEVPVLAVP